MHAGRKFFYWLLVYTVLVIVLAFSVPSFIHRRDFDKAFMAWQTSPTPENEATLRIHPRKNALIHLQDSAIAALVLTGLELSVYGGVHLGLKYRKRAKPHRT